MHIFLRYAAVTDSLPNQFRTVAYDARILYILSGRGTLLYGSQSAPLRPFTLCYYPPGLSYYPMADPDDPPYFVTLNFDFTESHTDQIYTLLPVPEAAYSPAQLLPTHLECGEARFLQPFVLDAPAFRDIMVQIVTEFGRIGGHGRACAAALLQCACYRLIDFPGDAQNQLVLRVLCYLDAHFAEPITNECIGRALHYHPNYLNAVFRQAVGLPLHRYLLQLRLQKAAAFLTAGNASVAQIAHDVGFENADHFSAAFTRQYGRAPTQYRSAHLI